MSGLASVFFGIWVLFFEPRSETVKSAFTWVAVIGFVVTFYQLWAIEHKKYLQEKARNASPEIKGEIKEVLEEYVNSAGGFWGFDYFFYVHLYLLNKGSDTNIQSVALKLIEEGQEYEGERISLKNNYYLEKQEPHKSESEIDMKTVHQDLVELEEESRLILKKNIGEERWVGFTLRNVHWSEEGASASRKIELTIFDGDGNPHVLPYVLESHRALWDKKPLTHVKRRFGWTH